MEVGIDWQKNSKNEWVENQSASGKLMKTGDIN